MVTKKAHIIQKISTIVLCLWALVSCQVIPEDERYIQIPKPQSERTHVLLEFTGFRCVNCPTAAQTAQQLDSLYGDKLIVVALHPASNPFTQGVYDYTCSTADEVYRFMKGTASTPFPTGNIDLQPYDGSYFMDPSEWGSQLLRLSTDTLAPYLTLTCSADTTEGLISFGVKLYSEEEVYVAIWLVEDSVMGVQAMPDGTVNTQYIHRHMLRSAAYSAWYGNYVPSISNFSSDMPIPEGCDLNHCSLVALLLDKTNFTILNAYETKMAYFSAKPTDD